MVGEKQQLDIEAELEWLYRTQRERVQRDLPMEKNMPKLAPWLQGEMRLLLDILSKLHEVPRTVQADRP